MSQIYYDENGYLTKRSERRLLCEFEESDVVCAKCGKTVKGYQIYWDADGNMICRTH